MSSFVSIYCASVCYVCVCALVRACIFSAGANALESPAFFAMAVEVFQKKWGDRLGSREVPDNGKIGRRVGAAVNYHEVPEMGEREGMPEASASYQELAKNGKGLPRASASCQEMAGTEGEKLQL